jgi:hypothetical protein
MGKSFSIFLYLIGFNMLLVNAADVRYGAIDDGIIDIEALVNSIPVVEVSSAASDSDSNESPKAGSLETDSKVRGKPVAMPDPRAHASAAPSLVPGVWCRVCPASTEKPAADCYLNGRYTVGQLYRLFKVDGSDNVSVFKRLPYCDNCSPDSKERNIKHAAAEFAIEAYLRENTCSLDGIASDGTSTMLGPTIEDVIAWAGPYLAEKAKARALRHPAKRPSIIPVHKRKYNSVLGVDSSSVSGVRKVVARTDS